MNIEQTRDDVAVETKRRANSFYTYSVQDGKQVFDFGTVGKIVFDANRASAENRARAMAHGFKQRIVDAGALSADPVTGKVSPAEKLAEMARIADHIMSGSPEWNIRTGGEGSSSGGGAVSLVSRALVRIGAAKDVVEANAKVKIIADRNFGGEMKKARDYLASSKALKEAIAAIQAEELAAKPTSLDADKALEELMRG